MFEPYYLIIKWFGDRFNSEKCSKIHNKSTVRLFNTKRTRTDSEKYSAFIKNTFETQILFVSKGRLFYKLFWVDYWSKNHIFDLISVLNISSRHFWRTESYVIWIKWYMSYVLMCYVNYVCVWIKSPVFVCYIYMWAIVWVDDRLLTRSSWSGYRLDN